MLRRSFRRTPSSRRDAASGAFGCWLAACFGLLLCCALTDAAEDGGGLMIEGSIDGDPVLRLRHQQQHSVGAKGDGGGGAAAAAAATRIHKAVDEFKRERDKLRQKQQQQQQQQTIKSQQNFEHEEQLQHRLRHQHQRRQDAHERLRELAWEQQQRHRRPKTTTTVVGNTTAMRYFDREPAASFWRPSTIAPRSVVKRNNLNLNLNQNDLDYNYEDEEQAVERQELREAKRYNLPLPKLGATDNDDVASEVDGDDYDYDGIEEQPHAEPLKPPKPSPVKHNGNQLTAKYERHYQRQVRHQHEVEATMGGAAGAAGGHGHSSAHASRAGEDDAGNLYSRYNIPGTLTRQKQEELGTPEAAAKSWRMHSGRYAQTKAMANAHMSQILKEASCRLPQRRVERIQRDPSKIYAPHCTILHRCSDDTGCCRNPAQTCAPKRTRNVELYFFVKSLNEKRGSIERLSLVNHTECHCVDRAKLGQKNDDHDGAGTTNLLTTNYHRATILNCNCPRLYEKILQEDGHCRCDCSSGNSGCDWLKRGMEHFSMNDRKCIIDGSCKPPTCEYGNFMRKHGRCPRREEQLINANTLS